MAILVALGAAGCDELLVSKETRQRIEAIKTTVTRNPGLIDAPDEQGEPPLHTAVLNGYRSLQVWLLDRHASPNARNARGQTALHVAALHDSSKDRWALRALIRAGADADALDEAGNSALYIAAAFGTEASVRVLLEAGADPRKPSQRGDTALHGAATPQPNRQPEECRRIIAELVAHGALPDARDPFGISPLHRAAMAGHVVAIAALLDAGAIIDLEGPDRATALSLAGIAGHAPAVALLSRRGAAQRQ